MPYLFFDSFTNSAFYFAKVKLINKETNTDDLKKYPDKVTKYLDVIFDHIKKHIIIE